MLRDLNNTQKAENVFIGMLGVTFLFWLLNTAPFILVDTLLERCFQKTGLHAAAYILNWTKVCSCHHPDIFGHEGSLAKPQRQIDLSERKPFPPSRLAVGLGMALLWLRIIFACFSQLVTVQQEPLKFSIHIFLLLILVPCFLHPDTRWWPTPPSLSPTTRTSRPRCASYPTTPCPASSRWTRKRSRLMLTWKSRIMVRIIQEIRKKGPLKDSLRRLSNTGILFIHCGFSGEHQANNPPRSLSRKESHALSTISTQSSCCCLPRLS